MNVAWAHAPTAAGGGGADVLQDPMTSAIAASARLRR